MPPKPVKLSYRVMQTLGLRHVSDNAEFDAAHHRYEFLRAFVDELRGCLETYVIQMEHLGESTRALADVISHMFTPTDDGYKAVIAFKAVQEEESTGYVNHLREALVKGVIADTIFWQKQIRALEEFVQQFREARLRYDYSTKKVDELRGSLSTASEKNKDVTSYLDRLQRNSIRLDEAKLAYDARTEQCCAALNKAWQERVPILNTILTRLIRFEESKHCHCLNQAFGLSQMLGTSARSAAAAVEASWIGSNGRGAAGAGDTEALLPMNAVKHHEGPLLRKGTVLKTKIYCKMVGSLLLAYEFSDDACTTTNSTCNHRSVLLEPKNIYDVTAVEQAGDFTFRVQVDGGKELLLATLTPEESPGWNEALSRAASWDARSCLAHMSQLKRSVQSLREEARSRRGDPPMAEVERVLGVSAAIAKPPPPPPVGMPPPLDNVNTNVKRQPLASMGKERTHRGNTFFNRSLNGHELKKILACVDTTAGQESPEGRGFSRLFNGLTPFNRNGSANMRDTSLTPVTRNPKKLDSISDNDVSASRFSSSTSPVRCSSRSHSSAHSAILSSSATNEIEVQTYASHCCTFQSLPNESSPTFQAYTEADPGHVREAFASLVASGGKREGRGGATLSVVIEWSEVQDLLKEGWVSEERVHAMWEAAREARGPLPLSAAAQGIGPGELDLGGFVLFVQLMEELRFEAELKANYGISLVDAPALCV